MPQTKVVSALKGLKPSADELPAIVGLASKTGQSGCSVQACLCAIEIGLYVMQWSR